MVGWVGACNERGSLDLVWSCLSTLFICLWVMLHLNVPSAREPQRYVVLRKLRWFILAILMPETLLLASGGQWASAHRSKADMKGLGHANWTMAHGFYANSGGFLLHCSDFAPFPVTAKQIAYLVRHNYIPCPCITKQEIFDKSKADMFTKSLACLQTSWFVIQCVARFAQSLPIAPLELCTCAIVLCTVTSFFFWIQKPLNVETPTTLHTTYSISGILVHAGERAEKPFRNTPLDFVEPNSYVSPLWPRFASLLGQYRHPFQRIPNDRNPELYNMWQRALFGGVVVVFSTISFADWHFAFPTRQEQLIWRATCLITESSLFLHGIAEAWAHRGLKSFLYIEGYKIKWPHMLVFVLPACLYFCARMLLISIAISTLRSLPRKCYLNVQWLEFLPHM
jgi:hypothetical protein